MTDGPHHGMPGPGGSMGTCAVCGENFIQDVICDLIGMESHIKQVNIGFIDGSCYVHAPDCVEAINTAFKDHNNDPGNVYDKLPDGPLKVCLAKAIEEGW